MGTNAAYQLDFTGQPLHTFWIGVQAATEVVLLFILMAASWPPLRGRFRRWAKGVAARLVRLLHHKTMGPASRRGDVREGIPPG